MNFQYVLKGIPELSDEQAREIIFRTGIRSNWLRSQPISAEKIKAKLTEENLFWHLSRYADVPPGSDRPFSAGTPFISTTAGTAVERWRRLYVRDAFYQAASFATRQFRRDGWIFYGYVYTLGKPSIPLQEFAEEVRNFHVYTRFLRYRYEGEITAKIEIPPVRLQRAEFYRGPELAEQLAASQAPKPRAVIDNDAYRSPEEFNNVLGHL